MGNFTLQLKKTVLIMSYQSEVNGTMYINHNCYFADCCLSVQEQDHFLLDSQLLGFLNEAAYQNKIELSISSGAAVNQKLETVFDSAGVVVAKTDDGGWLLSSDDEKTPCSIEANYDYSVLHGFISECGDQAALREKFMQLVRIATECHLSRSYGVSLHASCVCSNGEAMLFSAPSGTGKSTQADLWKEHLGARVINGDRPFLRIAPEGVRAYGVPWDGKEQIFLQENYPIRAIVELRQAKSNHLRKMSRDQAIRLLMKQCFIPMWDDEVKFLAVKTIRRIAGSVPFYRLFCMPEEGAAELLNGALFAEKASLLEEEKKDMKIAEGFILRNVVDEWIVMPEGSNIKNFEGAIVLNEVSAFIWKQLENPISREDLLKAILDEFEINEQEAATDLDEFLGELEARSFLSKD
ncbi:MAG: PqqD family peptide modification chaperone [Oscillospiraceae bacterium]|nr:PqqD family peptide modification chaperone [Oscillospiraceae bacterium]